MATLYDELELVRGELDRCMKCGNCMAVCPVYITGKSEAGVARGKIALAESILSGEIGLDDEDVVQRLFNCLVCKSCMRSCPSGVNFDRIMLSLRAAIVRKKGVPAVKRFIFGSLKRQRVFDAGMRIGAAVQGLAFRRRPDGDTCSPRFPLGLELRRVLPRMKAATFRRSVPERIAAHEQKTAVAFFTGCSINYLYPGVGHDILEVLKENSIMTIVPAGQHCCGMAVLAHGDVATARKMARSNINTFGRTGAAYIITACGSCGATWQREYGELLQDDVLYREKAEYWSKRTYDISTFLTKIVDYRRPRGRVEGVVTYHDSCHLKKTMGVYNEPRAILQAIPRMEFREMAKPDACCGGGGSYSITHYSMAVEIGKRKSADIDATRADTVASGCPACMMQLLDLTARFGKGQKIVHYITLLAESYRREKSEPNPGMERTGWRSPSPMSCHS